MDEQQMTEEQYLLDCIERIQAEYRKAAQPYVERLVRLRSMTPTPPMMFQVTQEMLDNLPDLKAKKPATE